eukprot:gene2798-2094_t
MLYWDNLTIGQLRTGLMEQFPHLKKDSRLYLASTGHPLEWHVNVGGLVDKDLLVTLLVLPDTQQAMEAAKLHKSQPKIELPSSFESFVERKVHGAPPKQEVTPAPEGRSRTRVGLLTTTRTSDQEIRGNDRAQKEDLHIAAGYSWL